MKSFVIIAAVSFLVSFGVLVTAIQAEAVIVPGPVCEKGEHVGNPHCFKPTPTPCIKISPSQEPSVEPTISVEPSVEVTETPTASPTAEVTVVPTTPPSPHGDFLSDGRESGHINAPSIPKGAPKTGRGR